MYKYPTLGPGDLPGDPRHPNSPDFVPDERETWEVLAESWADHDTEAVQEIMADYLDGPREGYAKAKLWREIIERAELVVRRGRD
jgi:hypothetical protein